MSRRRPDNRPIRLQRVLGLSVARPSGLAVAANSHAQHPDSHSHAPAQSLVAYPAGGIVVLYNHKRNKQTGFLIAAAPEATTSGSSNASKVTASDESVRLTAPGALPQFGGGKKGSVKPVSCVAFSCDGQLLAAGESGHQPRIIIWAHATGNVVSELLGHKFGVLALAFSPTNTKILVSVGFQHDGFIYVWNCSSGQKLACSRVSTKIHSIQFNTNGTFVTAGFRHFKFWNLDSISKSQKTSNLVSNVKTTLPLIEGIFGTVGEHKNSTFVDVACYTTPSGECHAYSITEKGLLVLFNGDYLMEKWVDLKVNAGFSISICDKFIACGCSDGVIRLFEPITLKYIATLPKPHPLGVDVSTAVGTSYKSSAVNSALYPNVTSIKIDSSADKIVCVYEDHSFFVWDVCDVKHIGKYRSFLYHSDCVWGVEMFPIQTEIQSRANSAIPPESFITYSSDDTIRFWNIDGPPNSERGSSPYLSGNIYSKELLKVLYIDSPRRTEDDPVQEMVIDKQVEKVGVRSLRVSSDGKRLAAGDRSGNLRVYEMASFEQELFMEAHDAEILSIDFSPCADISGKQSPLLATASRDRLIHIFDVKRSFRLIQTLEDHSSSITAVRFCENGSKLISSAADKSVIFRSLNNTSFGSPEFLTYHNAIGRATIYDIAVDPHQRHLAAVSQDRRLNIFSIKTGKPVHSLRPDPVDDPGLDGANAVGGLLKLCIDSSGRYAATVGTDKCIRTFDLSTGLVISRLVGHSEIVTGLAFSLDMSRLVSTGSDGLVLVWEVSPELSGADASSRAVRKEDSFVRKGTARSDDELDDVDDVSADITGPSRSSLEPIRDFISDFKDEDLPAWARPPRVQQSAQQDPSAALPKKGLWANRVGDGQVELFTQDSAADSPAVATCGTLFERRYSIEIKPDNCLEEDETVKPSSIENPLHVAAAAAAAASDAQANPTSSETATVSTAPLPVASESVSDSVMIVQDMTDEKIPGEAEEEPAIFLDVSDANNNSDEPVPTFVISDEKPILKTDQSDDALSAGEIPEAIEETTTSDSDGGTQGEGGDKPDAMEEFLLSPVDRILVRQSISAKHIAQRVRGQLKSPVSTSNLPKTMDAIADDADDEETEMPKVLVVASVLVEGGNANELKSAASSEENDKVPESAASEEDEIIPSPSSSMRPLYNPMSEVEESSNAEDEDTFNVVAIMRDLKQLRSLSEKSSTILRRLESKDKGGRHSIAEEGLKQELRSALHHVKSQAEHALGGLTNMSNADRTLELLETLKHVKTLADLALGLGGS